ncbi:MAG: ATP-binding cassette domain-containing protein [Bacilli bacterium]|nr:ATP-binding cassette domain-containing protein [Bacilli bacterium]
MLELKNVSKIFNLTGSVEDERIALDNVSLQIKPGEFVTIIGGNGSGKSTTLNIVSGSLIPDSGKVILNDVDITKMPEHRRAAYFGRVFQDPLIGTAADMSVLENLEIAYQRGRIHSPITWGFKKADKEYFIEELKRFDLGLENRLGQKVGVMSGGQRQALTLLMATIRHRPTIKMMRRDYILFSQKDKVQAANEFDAELETNKIILKDKLDALKNSNLSRKERRIKAKEAMFEFDQAMLAKFDLTKQILLLDEHTAALDPKTARKVLELTNKIVCENQMTTLMVTHNMKDALTYGNRLIMFHSGHIILDVSGKEKQKLKVDDLLKMFEEADEKLINE